ncbi:hypothetical protein CK203_001624 [Vitis vinifera]|uniref:Uncharacterized protein n=2 Tax=Vitis vinifera TaxID=29760 RepID=A0A438KM96_VITVI|nr:hypothetical protein CK203_001624 [Vitis vinifera]
MNLKLYPRIRTPKSINRCKTSSSSSEVWISLVDLLLICYSSFLMGVEMLPSVSSVNIHYLLANDTVDDIIWDVVQSKLENLGQMLDGHENTLEVSVSQPRSSPSKQRTIDSFMKRCNNVDNPEHQPNLKHPRN